MNELDSLKILEGRGYEINGNRVYWPAVFPALKEFNEQEGTAVFRISSRTKDRQGDTIQPEGMRAANFRKNPIVLWAHDYRGKPEDALVGKSLWEKVVGDDVIAKVKFADTDIGRQVKRLVKDGFLGACSVGFIPLKSELMGAETQEIPGGGSLTSFGYDVKEWELLEYSVVPIPCNPDAMTLEMRSTITHPILVKAFGLEARPVDEQIADVEKQVTEGLAFATEPEAAKDLPAEEEVAQLNHLALIKGLAEEVAALRNEAVVLKEGRVLSGRKCKLLQDCVDLMGETMDVMEGLLDETAPEKQAEVETKSDEIAIEEAPEIPAKAEVSGDVVEIENVEGQIEISAEDIEVIRGAIRGEISRARGKIV